MKTTVLAAGQVCLTVGNSVPDQKRASVSLSRRYLTLAVLSLAVFSTPSAFAKDPCKAVLCMFGKLTGNSGGSECRSAENEYFSIQVKKRGKIRWDPTSTAREQFLNSCQGADQGINKKSTIGLERSWGKAPKTTRRYA